MTSSLVGSEMCIRDRSKPWRGMAGTTFLLLTGVGAKGLKPGTAMSEPVSYTHLTLPTICSV
eukprot:4413980-Prorocentrum_lima.AAC.1